MINTYIRFISPRMSPSLFRHLSQRYIIITALNPLHNRLTCFDFSLSYLFFFLSFFLSFPAALRPNAGQDLHILEFYNLHTMTHHSLQDSSGRVISISQRPLPDKTQHSRQTYMPSVGFEPTISAGERSQTYALDRRAGRTGKAVCTDIYIYIYIYIKVKQSHYMPGQAQRVLRKLRLSKLSAQDGARLSALYTGRLYLQEILPVLISVRG